MNLLLFFSFFFIVNIDTLFLCRNHLSLSLTVSTVLSIRTLLIIEFLILLHITFCFLCVFFAFIDLDTSFYLSVILFIWHLEALSWQQHYCYMAREREKREIQAPKYDERQRYRETKGHSKEWLDQKGLLSIDRSILTCLCFWYLEIFGCKWFLYLCQ
jgi:hypothetical protein